MGTSEGNSLKNDIIATVIGGLILAALVYLGQWFISQIPGLLQRAGGSILLVLAGGLSVPTYLVVVSLVLTMGLSIVIALHYLKARRTNVTQSLAHLSQENEHLVQEIGNLQAELNAYASQTSPQLDNLAGLDDKVKLSASYHAPFSVLRPEVFSITLTWREVFAALAPALLEHPHETTVKNQIASSALFRGFLNQPTIDEQDYQTIKIHLRALQLISVDYINSATGGMGLFWSLTPKGEGLLLELRSVRKSDNVQ
jgi:hypothetical protein